MAMKMNNHGYVLVEIILASAIAFGIAYYMLDLTIKLKSKNDDLFVETQIMTDQAIIQNKLVEFMKNDGTNFTCNVFLDDGKVMYKDTNNQEYFIDKPSDYTLIMDIDCNKSDDNIVEIMMSMQSQIGKSYDIKLDYVLK